MQTWLDKLSNFASRGCLYIWPPSQALLDKQINSFKNNLLVCHKRKMFVCVKAKLISMQAGFTCVAEVRITLVSEQKTDYSPGAKLRKLLGFDTNYVTFAIRKFMLNMRSPGSFQNMGLLI